MSIQLPYKTIEDANPFLKNLPEEKSNCIKILIKWCTDFDVNTEGKTIWTFRFDDFDDGAYQGYYTFRFKQKIIDIWKVLEVANSVNWVGIRFLKYEAAKAMQEAIKKELEK